MQSYAGILRYKSRFIQWSLHPGTCALDHRFEELVIVTAQHSDIKAGVSNRITSHLRPVVLHLQKCFKCNGTATHFNLLKLNYFDQCYVAQAVYIASRCFTFSPFLPKWNFLCKKGQTAHFKITL